MINNLPKVSLVLGLGTSFYHENGHCKKSPKTLKIYQKGSCLYDFDNDPNHTEVTNFQNKVLRWQKTQVLRKKENGDGKQTVNARNVVRSR